MAIEITIWEPGRHVWNAVLIPLFVLLSPVILLVFLVGLPISFLFGNKKQSEGSDDS